MEAVSILFDARIQACNALFNMPIGEYLDSIRDVVAKNPYQHKRVSASKTIYSLLRQDLVKGCVIPPIVLALANSQLPATALTAQEAADMVKNHVADLLILDGLQRTLTLLDLEADVTVSNQIRTQPLRVEIYIGLNRIGILYRMLTLNTGQTPMSLRQQIEMLYLDYLDNNGLPGIKFIREVDEQHATDPKELNFKETIEGFNSYLERNELPLDRSDLLENIQSLENLSHENSTKDIFKEYVLAWMAFLERVHDLCGDSETPIATLPTGANLWGKTAIQVFKKAQPMTGFGAAAGKLKGYEIIKDIEDIKALCEKIEIGVPSAEDFLLAINKAVLWINSNTKKIGNAQRMYFQFFFRDLFNSEADSYLNLNESANSALHKVQSQLL